VLHLYAILTTIFVLFLTIEYLTLPLKEASGIDWTINPLLVFALSKSSNRYANIFSATTSPIKVSADSQESNFGSFKEILNFLL